MNPNRWLFGGFLIKAFSGCEIILRMQVNE